MSTAIGWSPFRVHLIHIVKLILWILYVFGWVLAECVKR